MIIAVKIILVLLLAYLTGSIPTSVWVGKWFFDIDVRDHGSGNAGATNTMRVLGVRTGIPVLIFDIIKGFLAVKYAVIFNLFQNDISAFINLSIALGILAVIGHIYPVYVNFRGGKGVATIFGVLLSLALFPTLFAAIVFIGILLLFKYVSLASVTAGLSLPFFVFFTINQEVLSLRIFSVLVAVLLIITHMKNLKRLYSGEEKKASFLFKKK